MKRKLVAFLLSACLLFPASLMFTACALFDKSSKDPETETGTGTGNGGTTPAAPTAAEIYAEALDNLDAILENATISIVPQVTYVYYDGYDDPERKNVDLGFYELEYRTANGDFAINIDDGFKKVYSIDDVLYTYTEGVGVTIDESIGSEYGYQRTTQSLAYDTFLSRVPTFINGFTSVAKYLNSDSITVVNGANNTKVLTVSLDLKGQLNSLVENYLTNKDQVIGEFVNTLLSDITGSEVDLLDIVDEFTDDMNRETTFDELFDYVANKLGTTKAKLITAIEGFINYQLKINSYDIDVTTTADDDYSGSAGSTFVEKFEAVSIDENILNMPIIPTMEAVINEDVEPGAEVTLSGTYIKLMVEEYFIGEEVSPSELIAMIIANQMVYDEDYYLDEEATEEYQQMLTTYVEMINEMLEYTDVLNAKLSVQFTLDANNNPTAFKLIAEGNVKAEDGENLSTASAYVTFDALISRVGTTNIVAPIAILNDFNLCIGLTGEQFMQNTVTVQVASARTPDDFTCVYDGQTVATFDADTKTLTLNMQYIRSLMDEGDNLFKFTDYQSDIDIYVSTYDEI